MGVGKPVLQGGGRLPFSGRGMSGFWSWRCFKTLKTPSKRTYFQGVDSEATDPPPAQPPLDQELPIAYFDRAHGSGKIPHFSPPDLATVTCEANSVTDTPLFP